MSKSELHDWECEIEELSGNNADKMLDIAQDIYNTAFVRGRNSMTWEQPRWIPVSERLPELCEEDCHGNITFSKIVLTTQIYGDGYVYVGIDKYTTNNGGGWLTEVPFDNPEECCKVIAWMPLPEPYKADNKTEQGLAYADQETMMPAT